MSYKGKKNFQKHVTVFETSGFVRIGTLFAEEDISQVVMFSHQHGKNQDHKRPNFVKITSGSITILDFRKNIRDCIHTNGIPNGEKDPMKLFRTINSLARITICRRSKQEALARSCSEIYVKLTDIFLPEGSNSVPKARCFFSTYNISPGSIQSDNSVWSFRSKITGAQEEKGFFLASITTDDKNIFIDDNPNLCYLGMEALSYVDYQNFLLYQKRRIEHPYSRRLHGSPAHQRPKNVRYVYCVGA